MIEQHRLHCRAYHRYLSCNPLQYVPAMRYFATAVLALLPALTSAHCVAQKVRVNGAVSSLSV